VQKGVNTTRTCSGSCAETVPPDLGSVLARQSPSIRIDTPQPLHGLPHERPLQAVCGRVMQRLVRLSTVPPDAIAANLKGGMF
jgi:hypothetical protein